MAKAKLGPVDWQSFAPLPVIGVDEVGRGCLAGPVVAAAVILAVESDTSALIPSGGKKRPVRRYFDSKQLSEKRREELFATIQAEHRWAVGIASVDEIDRINIYHATLLAMRRAILALELSQAGGHILVDGIAKIPDLEGWSQTTLVKGDERAEPVAAASIVAKVTRDRYMKTQGEKFPHYGFEVHKGYATLRHRQALAKVGPCALHRRSFNWGLDGLEENLESGEVSALDKRRTDAESIACGARPPS